jgi:hypothetical protein
MKMQLENKVLNEENPADTIEDLSDVAYSYYGPSYSVSEELRKRGYEIAGHMNLRIPRQKNPMSAFIGILKNQKPVQKKIFGIKLNRERKAVYLGRLWFNNESKMAVEDEKWVLDVYGRRNLSELTKLLNSISKDYGVKVKVNLKSEYPIQENYLSDII